MGELAKSFEDSFGFDKNRFSKEHALYNRSSVLDLMNDDLPKNAAAIDSVRKKEPRVLERAKKKLGLAGIIRVLEAVCETEHQRSGLDKTLERIKRYPKDKDEVLNRFINRFYQGHYSRIADGFSIKAKGVELADQHPKEAAYVADYLIETARELTAAAVDRDPPFTDPYRGQPYMRYSNLRAAYGVDLLVKSLKIKPSEAAGRLWRVGIKNQSEIAAFYVERNLSYSIPTSLYHHIMSPETIQYLKMEHPEVLKSFFAQAPEHMPSKAIQLAFQNDVIAHMTGIHLKPLFRKLDSLEQTLLEYHSHANQRILLQDLAKIVGDYLSTEGKSDEQARQTLLEYAFPSVHNVLSSARFYLETLDERNAMLEQFKERLSEEQYRALGYADLEMQTKTFRERLANCHELIEKTMIAVRSNLKPSEVTTHQNLTHLTSPRFGRLTPIRSLPSSRRRF